MWYQSLLRRFQRTGIELFFSNCFDTKVAISKWGRGGHVSNKQNHQKKLSGGWGLLEIIYRLISNTRKEVPKEKIQMGGSGPINDRVENLKKDEMALLFQFIWGVANFARRKIQKDRQT